MSAMPELLFQFAAGGRADPLAEKAGDGLHDDLFKLAEQSGQFRHRGVRGGGSQELSYQETRPDRTIVHQASFP